jgi:two-component sensor histidine kinase
MTDPDGLQKLVGIVITSVAALSAAFNVIVVLRTSNGSFFSALLDWYVIAIALIGAIALVSFLWISKITKWFQISIFFATALLSAFTSTTGNLTGGIFLVFGLILISQYNLGRYAIWIGAIFSLVPYPIALAVGLSASSTAFLSQLAADMVMLLCLIVLYGGVLLRHELRHRQDVALLETRVKERTAELEKALAERSVILQEIHHRVRNNLQLVTSMLQLEAGRQEDPSFRGSMEASIQRIYVMALVHEILYATEELDDLDLVRYSDRLLDAFRDEAPFEFRLEAEAPIPVGLDFAVPFGLLLNELVSNANKHAFPEGYGRIDIRIERTEGGLRLVVADEGVGIPEAYPVPGTKTLGLTLVDVLVKQLGGEASLERRPGTKWTIAFPLSRSP